MYKTFTMFLIALLLCPGLLLAADEAALKAEAATIIKAYVTELKGALTTAMTKGGPVAAIETCRLQAPGIAAKLSAAGDWQVSRTSLRTRNQGNRPDAWEQAGLEAFEKALKNGSPAGKLVQSAIVEDAGGRSFRLLKAIPTGKLCLKCHGDALVPEVQQALKVSYPNDQATGFHQGDIRGAFSLRKQLD